MKFMKKILNFMALFAVLSLLCGAKAYAITDENDISEEILKASGADSINTEYVQEYLDEYGISLNDADSVSNIGITTVLKAMASIFAEKAQLPLKLFCTSLGVIFITAALGACTNRQTFNCHSVATIANAAFLCPYFRQCLEMTCKALCDGAEFFGGFVPVFSAITLFSGFGGVSSVYSSAMLSFCAIASLVSQHILMPALSCLLALSIVNAASPVLNLTSLISGAKRLTTAALLLITVIFVGLLSLQTTLASSADSLSMRTSKYIVSSSIPIVGSAVGEAYSSVVAGIGVIRASTGVFGVLCVAFICLPVLAFCFATYLSVKSAGVVAEFFGIDELKSLFFGVANVLSIALAVLICFMLMVLICTAIIMTAAKGG